MDWKQLREDVNREQAEARLVCISGSLPPNSSNEDFQVLLNKLVETGKQVWVDTSGTALKTVLQYPQLCIKVNGFEMGEALGIHIDDLPSAEKALDVLGEHAPIVCLITLGSKGALLATSTER